MNIETGDFITAGENKFITLEKLTYMNKEYLIVNRAISEDELSDEFYIFVHDDTKLKKVVDQKILEVIVPQFEKLLKRDLETLL